MLQNVAHKSSKSNTKQKIKNFLKTKLYYTNSRETDRTALPILTRGQNCFNFLAMAISPAIKTC